MSVALTLSGLLILLLRAEPNRADDSLPAQVAAVE
jgi:hypothetical protein